MAQFDHLRQFIELVRNAGFWQRIFGWNRIRQSLAYAASDLASMETLLKERDKTIAHLQNEMQWEKQNSQTLAARKDELLAETAGWKKEFFVLQRDMEKLQQQL